MTTAKALEYRIVRNLLQRRTLRAGYRPPRLAERLILLLAATAGVVLVATLMQELLWALLTAGTVLLLGDAR